MADPPSSEIPDRPGAPGPGTRRAALNAAVSTLAEVAGKAATLAFTIAATRILGAEDYGAFAYAISFSALVATLPGWGFDLMLLQRGSADLRSLPRLLSETLVWRSAIAVPVFAAAGIAGFVIRPSFDSALALLFVLAATMIDLYAESGKAAATALQDQVGISKALIAQRFAAAVLGIGALVVGLGLVGLAAAYLLATFVGAFGVAASVRRLGVRLDLRSVHRRGLLESGKLSIAIGIDTVISLALFRIDQVLLSTFKGDAALGPYAAAYRLVETVIFVSWAVAKAVFPVMSGAKEAWRIRRGIEQGLSAVAVLYIPFAVGMAVEAEGILGLLFGERFATAGAPAARWLAVTPLLFAFGYLGSYALLALERRWLVVAASIVALVVNVGANLVLIPLFSGEGAAIATVLSYGLEGIVTMIFLLPLLGRLRLLGGLLLPVLASGPMAATLVLLDLPMLIEVAIGGVLYLGLWLVLARWRSPEQIAVLASVLPGRRGRDA